MEESPSIGRQKLPLDKWTEEDVSSWLRRVGIKECYINKLQDEEVTGPVLASLHDDFLRKNIGMKSGQIELLLTKRGQLKTLLEEERDANNEDVLKESTVEGRQNKMPPDKWTEDDVSSWLRRVGIKECYINKLQDEEVTGPVLASLHDDFLRKNIGMKSGQIELLLTKRGQLKTLLEEERDANNEDVLKESTAEPVLVCNSQAHINDNINQQPMIPKQSSEDATPTETLTWSKYRELDQDGKDFRYIKHCLLEPETGIDNLLMPCHEYKSLEIAHKLDSKRLQAKVASEVLRFACACMNMRANGTIHFGVMDKVKGPYKHGEIIGIDLQNREDFVDALDYIEKCFSGSGEQCDARKCIRNPKFIEVIEKEAMVKTYVVEYDVVPKASIVKGKFYSVGVPKFTEKDKKN